MQIKLVLGYWAIRGLAQRIKLIMEYTGLAYDQELFFAQERTKWFNERKPQLLKKNPAINLPFLLDGEKVITESEAIIIYVVNKSGKKQLLGRNIDQQVTIATAYGVLKDLHSQYIALSYGSHGMQSYEAAHTIYVEKFKTYLAKLSGLLGDKKWFCGQITWVDFAIGEEMNCLFLQTPELREAFKNLSDHQERLFGLPELQSYFKSDRWKERPCNNIMAQWK